MKSCEEYQINLSAMMDGELTGDELTETIQHLAACADCLREFRSFQSLQSRVNQEIKTPAVPNHLWTTISREERVTPRTQFIVFRPSVLKWVGIAAVFLLSFGSGYLLRAPVRPLSDPRTPIVLASNRGSLTDDQFLILTRTLLTADPVYHKKMYLILHTLLDLPGEGGLDILNETDAPPLVTPILSSREDSSAVYKF